LGWKKERKKEIELWDRFRQGDLLREMKGGNLNKWVYWKKKQRQKMK